MAVTCLTSWQATEHVFFDSAFSHASILHHHHYSRHCIIIAISEIFAATFGYPQLASEVRSLVIQSPFHLSGEAGVKKEVEAAVDEAIAFSLPLCRTQGCLGHAVHQVMVDGTDCSRLSLSRK